jgi:hypothetical protein
MARARELSDVEKFYIENNSNKTDAELADMMVGISSKKVSAYRSTIKQDSDNVAEESEEERKKRLSKVSNVGDFFAQRKGSTIMTEQVSEITDARKIVKGNQMSSEQYDENNRGKIHRPKN